MTETIAGNLLINSRVKVYLILVFISLILFFYSAWQVKPVIVEVEASFGLASYLKPGYWIGLALLLLTSIFAFLDRELKKECVFITILLALGIFLLGIRVFVEVNAVDATAYYPTAEVKNLLAVGHIDITSPPHIASYYTWPAIHFISAWIFGVTGLDLMLIMKYAPVFWIVCFVFITYAIGKRLQFESNRCFCLCLLSVSSWLIAAAGYYYARLPAMIFLLTIFMFVVVPRRVFAETIVIILLSSALVMSHGLTAVAVIPGLALLALYNKELRLITLYLLIFGAWYLSQATATFEIGINAFTEPLKDIFELLRAERYQTVASIARLVNRYSELCYAALYALLMLGSTILLLKHKIIGEIRQQVITLFLWTAGVGIVVFWGHGEAVFRTFNYCIVPALCIAVLSFSSRKLLIPLFLFFVFLSPLANYAGLAGWGQVTTTELKGTEFFALYVKPQDSYFYGPGGQLVLYYAPELVSVPRYDSAFLATSPREVDLSVLDKTHYVIINKIGSDFRMFSWGVDPYIVWPQTQLGQRAAVIYHNGTFQIYINHLNE